MRLCALALLGIVAALGSGDALCAGITVVEIRVRGGKQANGAVIAKAMDGHTAPIEAPFFCGPKEGCAARLELPSSPSGWQLSASAPGYWATPQSLGSGGTVDLWPVGFVEGALRNAGSPESISQISVKFTPSPSWQSPAGFPEEATVTCPVADGRFSCPLPAGKLDLRLRAKGHVSVYRWSQTVSSGGGLAIGTLELKRGASLVGKIVSTDRDAPKTGACTVRLETPGDAGREAKRSSELPRAGVDGRGFFHLEVVPPGRWILIAEQEGFAPARRVVNVVEGMEANLVEPLVLARPARLELTLLPPQDPNGKPWMVELLEARDGVKTATIVTAPASLGGSWSTEGLASGRRLMVRVRTSTGQAWWADSSGFELTGPIHRRTVELGVEEITGTLRLGKEPLAGLLTFGAPEENVAIEIRSDEDGQVRGLLPRLGAWRVLVSSEMPALRRQLDVDIPRGPDGRGRIELELADRALTGEIVDEDGKHLERALLTITASATERRESAQERVEGGMFRVTGYEPGRYLLRAVGGGRVSETVPVEIASDGSSPFVRIVAVPRAVIDLRLLTESGSPIPAARVELLRTTQFPGLSSMSGRTDTAGRVSFPTHPGVAQQCFAVSQPGLPFRVFAVAPGPDMQDVVVPTAGGTLEIEAATPKEGEVVLLWQGGCFVPFPLLKARTGGDATRFPSVAPGEYRLCRHPAGTLAPTACSSGFLASYGVLPLRLKSGH